MVDGGQLGRRAVLRPRDGLVAVHHQRGVGCAGLDVLLLQLPVGLGSLPALGAVGMEPDAPAATEDPVVSLHEGVERRPRLGRQRADFQPRVGARLGTHGLTVERLPDDARPDERPGISPRRASPRAPPGRSRHVKQPLWPLGLVTARAFRGSHEARHPVLLGRVRGGSDEIGDGAGVGDHRDV